MKKNIKYFASLIMGVALFSSVVSCTEEGEPEYVIDGRFYAISGEVFGKDHTTVDEGRVSLWDKGKTKKLQEDYVVNSSGTYSFVFHDILKEDAEYYVEYVPDNMNNANLEIKGEVVFFPSTSRWVVKNIKMSRENSSFMVSVFVGSTKVRNGVQEPVVDATVYLKDNSNNVVDSLSVKSTGLCTFLRKEVGEFVIEVKDKNGLYEPVRTPVTVDSKKDEQYLSILMMTEEEKNKIEGGKN